MPIINTPGYYKKLSDFYYQISALVSAGVPLINALENFVRGTRSSELRRVAETFLYRLRSGLTPSEALRTVNNPIPEFDIALIEAGEKSGRLDFCFKMLSEYYQERGRLLSQLLSELAYPVFLLHFAVFIFPFPEFFVTGNIGVYLTKTIGILLPIYLVVFGLVYLTQSQRRQNLRALIERISWKIPILGAGRKNVALARLCISLESLLNAGMDIARAWELAAEASGSVRLKNIVSGWRYRYDTEKVTPAELVTEYSEFPEVFTSQYYTAEASGKLEETLRRLHFYFMEEGIRRLKSAARWFAQIIFLIIALIIAAKIIMFYVGYFQQIGNAMEGF